MCLRLDWATYESAKYAVEHWHYSKRMPKSKIVRIGIWEDEKFIGVVIFGVGASAVAHLQYKVNPYQICELVRVALSSHKAPVTNIISKSISFLKKKCPNLQLITSFADPFEGHVGIIYQAGNWIYAGKTAEVIEFYYKGGWKHVTGIYKSLKREKIKTLKTRRKPAKYKYLMPLDKQMRKQIEPLRQPYPKRMPLGDSQRPVEDGGAIPTHTLQTQVAVNG